MLLVRHPAAGFLVRRFERCAGAEETPEWTLPPAAGPLRLRVVDGSGSPVPWARLALTVDGGLLAGSLLRWLTGADAADAAGLWQGQNLPATPLAALALPAGGDGLPPVIGTGSLATEIAPPWPSVVELTAVP